MGRSSCQNLLSVKLENGKMGKLFVVWFMFALENVKVVIRAAIITGDSSNNATKHQMLNRMQLISAPKTKKKTKANGTNL